MNTYESNVVKLNNKRLTIIEYKNKNIIFINGNSADKEEGYQLALDFEKIITSFPLESALILHDITNLTHNPDALNLWKSNLKHHEKYVKKNAVIGAVGILKIVLITYKTFGRFLKIDMDAKMQSFNSIQEGKNWLIKD